MGPEYMPVLSPAGELFQEEPLLVEQGDQKWMVKMMKSNLIVTKLSFKFICTNSRNQVQWIDH